MLSLKDVRDEDLLRRLLQLVKQSRGVEAELVAHIGEVELRRLYAHEACSSMFEYCRRILGLRENEAYLRITVARAAREQPVLVEMLRDGRLHLSGIARLAPHLTGPNADAILSRACGMSYREIRELVAELEPRPDVTPSMRKLPERPMRGNERRAPGSTSRPLSERPAPSVASHQQLGAHRVEPDAINLTSRSAPIESDLVNPETSCAALESHAVNLESGAVAFEARVATPARPAVAIPLAPGRYQVRFTASGELREKLERLQALMRSSVPDADLARIIDIAVTEKLQRVEAKRFGKAIAPRKRLAETDTTASSRHIPAAVRRLVNERDGGRCAFRDRHGRRCDKRHNLEFHHKQPFARGGDHSPVNLTLMCRAHNTLLAEQDYGEDVMARFRAVTGQSKRSFQGPRVPRDLPPPGWNP